MELMAEFDTSDISSEAIVLSSGRTSQVEEIIALTMLDESLCRPGRSCCLAATCCKYWQIIVDGT